MLLEDKNNDAVDMQAVENLSARMNRGYFSKKAQRAVHFNGAPD